MKAVDGARPDGAVDEFSATSGKPIARIAEPPFQTGNPGGAITSGGGRVWVTDTNFYSYRGWVAELKAPTAAPIRVIGASSGHSSDRELRRSRSPGHPWADVRPPG